MGHLDWVEQSAFIKVGKGKDKMTDQLFFTEHFVIISATDRVNMMHWRRHLVSNWSQLEQGNEGKYQIAGASRNSWRKRW